MLITDGILLEYQRESEREPQFQPQPILDSLASRGRAMYLAESQLTPSTVQLTGFPREHRAFILDAIAAQASYLVTHRSQWLSLSPQTSHHGLQVVTPRQFIELQG